jgi:hypothetical protein
MKSFIKIMLNYDQIDNDQISLFSVITDPFILWEPDKKKVVFFVGLREVYMILPIIIFNNT